MIDFPASVRIFETGSGAAALILFLILPAVLSCFFFYKHRSAVTGHSRQSGRRCKPNPCLVSAVLLMMATVFPLSAVSADEGPGILLGEDAVTTGNRVYFGSYNGSPVLWRVLGTGNAGSGMLLQSDDALAVIMFDSTFPLSNVWQGSEAQAWCKAFFSNDTNFSASERSAVIETSKEDDPLYSYDSSYEYEFVSRSSLENEYIFFLSVDEVFGSAYPDADTPVNIYYDVDDITVTSWWLRSPMSFNDPAVASAGGFGSFAYGFLWSEDYGFLYEGARPAFNLDPSNVLFASLIPGSSNQDKQYKLTMKEESSALAVTPDGIASRAGDEINKRDEETVITVYLIWDSGYRPEEPVVYILPEDEIGAYKLLPDGSREYLLFHTYDICMRYLGRDELCRGPERCFHKDRK